MSSRAIFTACVITSVFMPAGAALASNKPIPGIDIVVKKKPGGQAIRVGDCQSGGGRVVKQGANWVCTGLRATSADSKQGRIQPNAGTDEARAKQKNPSNTEPRKPSGQRGTIGFAPLKPAEF